MEFIFDNDRPIYLQLVEQLRTSVISGAFSPGERLPSVRELASQAKVNPNTIQRALTELEVDGLIFTQRTNGKFVTRDTELIAREKQRLARRITLDFLNDMKKIGVSAASAEEYLHELGGQNDGDA